MYELIVPILILFMCLFYHDIPLEWQGFTGCIVGFIAALSICHDNKKE